MLRIGAVSYLNTRPLVYGLRERLAALPQGGALSFDLPSVLADRLHAGQLDVALIPVVEYLRGSGYRIVSDAAIACRGPVLSVRLLSRVPIASIGTLAMDEGSRTSQALVQVLLWEQFGLRPRTVSLPISASPESVDADAVLLIGDRAMHPAAGVYQEIWDLGDRWCRWSELPFVFAVWVARGDVDTRGLAEALQASRDEGLEHLQGIAQAEAGRHGLTVDDCLAYFARNLHFHFGPAEQRGLRRFHTAAAALGLAPLPSLPTADGIR